MVGRAIWAVAAAGALLSATLWAPMGAWASETGEDIDRPPDMSPDATPVETDFDIFKADPEYVDKPYDPERQIEIYGGKYAIDEPRPVLEIGRPLYREGPFREGIDVTGEKNLVYQHFMVYGDFRNAIGWSNDGATERAVIATRLNLDIDWKLTATERLHAFIQPLDNNGRFTSWEFAGDDARGPTLRANGDIETFFFEGDVGAIAAGLTNEYNSLDLPFSLGLNPIFLQNGVWVDDAFLGAAVAIPSINSPTLDISNADVTFFFGVDQVTTPAIKDGNGDNADHNINIYGIAAFVEALEGYFEGGYGFVQGEDNFEDQSYHNATLAFTRRYGGWLSNSVRAIWTTGQHRENGAQQTADGLLFLFENSLITHKPLTLIPYANGWVGLDRPQPLAKDVGPLKNTGINFEADALTQFPKLDDTGQNTYGAAIGLEYLFNLDQQIVVEGAVLDTFEGDNEPGRPAKHDQYALGFRYQLPVTNWLILRADGMYGWRMHDDDVSGARFEVRAKF